MNKSNHAIKRTQKRGISNIAIELLFAEGKILNQKGGTALIVFPKSKKSIKLAAQWASTVLLGRPGGMSGGAGGGL